MNTEIANLVEKIVVLGMDSVPTCRALGGLLEGWLKQIEGKKLIAGYGAAPVEVKAGWEHIEGHLSCFAVDALLDLLIARNRSVSDLIAGWQATGDLPSAIQDLHGASVKPLRRFDPASN